MVAVIRIKDAIYAGKTCIDVDPKVLCMDNHVLIN